MSKVLRFKVSLKGLPSVWRRFLISEDASFRQLHNVLQVLFDWEDYHLHEFTVNKVVIGVPDDDSEPDFDERKSKIGSFVSEVGQKLFYEYDFGDNWQLIIVLEKILIDFNGKVPACIDGAMNSPPEDCGGVGGYKDMLKAISDKKNPENEEMLEWVGGEFDKNYFNVDEVNTQL